MPTLNWVGKAKVITHHLDVPYRVLDRRNSGYVILHSKQSRTIEEVKFGTKPCDID